jgi:hypothetical protein
MIRIAECCPDMEVFDLYLCRRITDIGMVGIAECSNIHLLEMRITKITDISAFKIAEFCPNIEILSITDSDDITDASIMRIAELCSNLKELDIHCSGITDASVIKIAECCPYLTLLYISGCRNFADASIMRIAECCCK